MFPYLSSKSEPNFVFTEGHNCISIMIYIVLLRFRRIFSPLKSVTPTVMSGNRFAQTPETVKDVISQVT